MEELANDLRCTYIFTRGHHKGERCGRPVVTDGYCNLCMKKSSVSKFQLVSDFSMFDIATICNYVSLCNFLEKKQGRATLIGSHQVNVWGVKLRGLDYKDIYYIGMHTNLTRKKYAPISDNFEITRITFDHLNISELFDKLFEITQGKMSLCGGAVLHQMGRFDGWPNDFDFFFHCDNVQEADDLLKLCMKTIADHFTEHFDEYFDRDDGNLDRNDDTRFHGAIRYSRSQGTQTVSIYPKDNEGAIKLQFIRRNYQHKDQILLGFDLPCCQYGFNPRDGFFTTIPGGMAYALGMFPLDLTQRSLSFGFRLRKYVGKGFVVLLPGLDRLDSDELITPDGRLIEMGERLTFARKERPRYWTSEANGSEPRVSDYDSKADMNWFYIATEKIHNVTFYSDTWEELYDMSEAHIRENLFKRTKYPVMDITKLYIYTPIIRFLGDKIGEFSETRDQSQVLAQDIWNSRIKYFQDRAVEIYKFINEPENAWRYLNAGGQNFGKFNPLITNPRDWYGPNYKPVTVGITSERIQVLRSYLECMFPEDVLNLLCYWWLIAEVQDAKNYLFGIGPNTLLGTSNL